MRGDGSERVNVTNHPANDDDPAFDPSGARIVFTSDRDGNPDIYVMNDDGSGLARLTLVDPAIDQLPEFSPDGSRIVFTSNRGGNFDIFVMTSSGTDVTQLTTDAGDDVDPTFSPDGSKIAFWSDRDGKRDIWVMNADGTLPTNYTPGSVSLDQSPAFSRTASGSCSLRAAEVRISTCTR